MWGSDYPHTESTFQQLVFMSLVPRLSYVLLQPAHVGAVHIPVHAHHRRPDRLELAEHLERREVAGVQEQVGARDPLDARIRKPPRAPRQVRVGYDGDQHPGTRLTGSPRP